MDYLIKVVFSCRIGFSFLPFLLWFELNDQTVCYLQYKLPKGGAAIRTDIQVGDDTRSFFSVSLWQKQMGQMAISGNVILLQSEYCFFLFSCFNSNSKGGWVIHLFRRFTWNTCHNCFYSLFDMLSTKW